MSRRFRPDRRTFLRSTLGGLAIPFLPSAQPRAAWADTPTSPRRLLYWFLPNGIQMDWWTPSTTGFGYDLPTILAPLAAVQDDVSVLTGLSADAGYDEIEGDHARGTGCFLTAARIRFSGGDDIYAGTSVDQVAAQAMGHETVFPSLELGIDGGTGSGTCDAGYSCVYAHNIAWASPTTPLPKITDPVLAFERMFGGEVPGRTPEEQARALLLRTSVLDYALDDASRLHSRLGTADARKLDEYLTGVRELETRVQSLAEAVCNPDIVVSHDASVPETVRMMTDITMAALECDLTRIVTFMLGNGGTGRSRPHLGIYDSHHTLSHHGGDAEAIEKLVRIATWEIEEVAYLVERLGRVTDASGERLLDNTLLYVSSEIEDGDTHDHRNMPVLLAGAGGGVHTPGRHVVYNRHEPMADLFISMLSSVGVEVSSFGDDGTGPLDGLV